MPTNVTPEYRKAEEAFREARTTEEKIARLEDMIALLPKHKGTDHLFADLKRRMAKLKADQEASGRRAGRGSGPDFTREGAAQVVLLGPPNSGKSSILKALTHAAPEIADYPFTTQHLLPGMMSYQDIQIQLVDSPPVTSEFMPLHLPGLVRGADAALLVADLGSDAVLEDLEAVLRVFSLRQVRFVPGLTAGGGGIRRRVPRRAATRCAPWSWPTSPMPPVPLNAWSCCEGCSRGGWKSGPCPPATRRA